MAGIDLSESTVQRTTEKAGERIAATLQEGKKAFGPKQPWQWYCDALGRRVAYIGLDATGVRQQGPHGEKADGRMANVGVIFNPLPDPKRGCVGRPKPGTVMQARYISGLYPLAEMGPLLRRQAAQVGMDQADIWVALTDGGSGLESFMEAHFPRVEAVILDFWHAKEYLVKLAKALHPKDEDKTQEQISAWCHLLKEEGGYAMLGVLRAWDWPNVGGLRAVRDEVLTYFENQKDRMDYPHYEGQGWFIGSGVVESACKTVVGQRLKNAGMRWREPGSHAVCHVRALYRSEHSQWQAYWRRNTCP
jgi:hypothetical protein